MASTIIHTLNKCSNGNDAYCSSKEVNCQHPKMAVDRIDDVIKVEMRVNVVYRHCNDARWVVTCQSNY